MKRNKLKPITFSCTKCGDCCKSDGFIQMEEKEIVAISYEEYEEYIKNK